VRDDIAPPAHVVATVQPHSLLAGALNSLVGAVYGPPQVLQSIYQITTDSSGRLVLSDPALQAIHVLDPKGRRSFSLLGGPGRYLHQPAGVAIDGSDNIYVADSERGMVLVYDQEGRFLRYIGNFHGENWYQYPTGIAIDRTEGLLYVADSPRNLIFELDLQGEVLKHFGQSRARAAVGEVEFDFPTRIAKNGNQIAVLDNNGDRVQIIDADGKLLRSFKNLNRWQSSRDDAGLAFDREGNLYLSDARAGAVWVYRDDQWQVATSGKSGSRTENFQLPKALWIDDQNRLYVTDAENVSVIVFRLGDTKFAAN
jgi:DNA-binding beta-propeller fold protein YncE